LNNSRDSKFRKKGEITMKRSTVINLLCVLAIFMSSMTTGCSPPKPEEPQVDNGQADDQVPGVPQATQPDLQITNIRVERSDLPNFTHQIIATLKNNGSGVASGFNAGCTYQCPGGTNLSAGLNIVQAGYLEGNQEFIYNTPFRFQCDPTPVTVNLVCDIDYENDLNESNNAYYTSINP
jgi:hypothetical protein